MRKILLFLKKLLYRIIFLYIIITIFFDFIEWTSNIGSDGHQNKIINSPDRKDFIVFKGWDNPTKDWNSSVPWIEK